MTGIERRMHARKNIDDSALIHFNTTSGPIEKSGKVENVSLGGICFNNIRDIHGGMINAPVEGDQTAVYFRSTPISVFGVVTRADKDGKIAIKIKQSTDDSYWEKIST